MISRWLLLVMGLFLLLLFYREFVPGFCLGYLLPSYLYIICFCCFCGIITFDLNIFLHLIKKKKKKKEQTTSSQQSRERRSPQRSVSSSLLSRFCLSSCLHVIYWWLWSSSLGIVAPFAGAQDLDFVHEGAWLRLLVAHTPRICFASVFPLNWRFWFSLTGHLLLKPRIYFVGMLLDSLSSWVEMASTRQVFPNPNWWSGCCLPHSLGFQH